MLLSQYDDAKHENMFKYRLVSAQMRATEQSCFQYFCTLEPWQPGSTSSSTNGSLDLKIDENHVKLSIVDTDGHSSPALDCNENPIDVHDNQFY